MSDLLAMAGIAGALCAGVVSPGPSFVMIARTSVASGRECGVAAALGMGLGGVLFATAALLGLQSVLLAVPSLYLALKLVGGLYLAYLGLQIWKGATSKLSLNENEADQTGQSFLKWFGLGAFTQLSNPKTAIVYASVFAAFLPSQFNAQFGFTLIAVVFLIETGWYCVVSLALSATGPRGLYLHYKSWADRTAGTVMVGLGLKLAYSARD